MPTPGQPGREQEFALLGTDGFPYTLSDHRGEPLVVAFFKTTCSACMLTFPYLEQLHRAYGKNAIAIWGISQDTLDDSLAFAVDHGVTFPILLDTDWQVSVAYGVETVPSVFLLEGNGDIAFSFAGFSKADLNEMTRLIALESRAEPVVIAPDGDGKPPFRPG